MITISIIILVFICLIIIGVWYNRIIPCITNKISKIFPSSPPMESNYSIDESLTEIKEYPKLEDIKDPTPMKMNISHLIYLIYGIVVWGILIGAIIKLFFWKEISIIFIEILYIVLTAFITLFIQWYGGGFNIKTPKYWFYIPLGSWIVFIVWGNVETIISGGEPFFFDFFR